VKGREVFSRIARRYDGMNRLLSLGQDDAWRRAAIRHLPPGRVLDLGAGTGAANDAFDDREVFSLDPAPEMLALNPGGRRLVGVGESLPFSGSSFDGVFCAYVLRNLESIPRALGEIHRVLRPGGAAAIIDLARPPSRLAAAIHRAGTAVLLPALGLVAGAPREYWYLHRSLDSLPGPEVLFGGGPLAVERVWRMGTFGFVYGVVLRKT
jgi:demethylmenaquinone methyltransferase/2-methoxy-6-polyprenyl-1,4-benzoquinol methylase